MTAIHNKSDDGLFSDYNDTERIMSLEDYCDTYFANHTLNGSFNPYSYVNIIGLWLTGSLCVMGFVLNSVAFIVMLRSFSKISMWIILMAIALCDNLFMLSYLASNCVTNVHNVLGYSEALFRHRGEIQRYMWPITMTWQLSSTYLTCFVSIERYIAVCDPLHASQRLTTRRVRGGILAIFLASTLYNIPRFWEFITPRSYCILKNEALTEHFAYKHVYTSTLYAVFMFIIPVGILTFCNVKIIRETSRMCHGCRQPTPRSDGTLLRQPNRGNSATRRLSKLSIYIVFSFALLTLPSVPLNFLDAYSTPIIYETINYELYVVIANLLMVVNTSLNFFLYYFVGEKFRNSLKDLIYCCTKPGYKKAKLNTTVRDYGEGSSQNNGSQTQKKRKGLYQRELSRDDCYSDSPRGSSNCIQMTPIPNRAL